MPDDSTPTPLDIICPECFARWGEPCKPADGAIGAAAGPRKHPHAARVRQFKWVSDPRNAP